jgi:ATP-dependent Clp protease protease subunit
MNKINRWIVKRVIRRGKMKMSGEEEDNGVTESDNKAVKRDNNHIYFYTEVDRQSILDLIWLIREVEEENKIASFKLHIDDIPIYLHINSNGGDVFEAFNAMDAIRSCRVPVHTIIEGATASAGTLMSVVGKKRYICPSAYMLIHQLSSTCWGKMSEIEDEYKNLQECMDRIRTIYKEYTKIPKKELTELLKHDLWLNAEKSLKYGLVDEIWR